MGFLPCSGSRKAFTLVELMVVVAIIALLISILLPSLAKAREQAYQVKCASNLKSIWLGIFYYAEDKANGNGYLVQLSNQWAAASASQIYPGAYWPYQILPYVSVGRSLWSKAYITGEYTTYLSTLHVTNPNDFTIETRPRTNRIGASGLFNVTRRVSLVTTIERTKDGASTETRAFGGFTLRF